MWFTASLLRSVQAAHLSVAWAPAGSSAAPGSVRGRRRLLAPTLWMGRGAKQGKSITSDIPSAITRVIASATTSVISSVLRVCLFVSLFVAYRRFVLLLNM